MGKPCAILRVLVGKMPYSFTSHVNSLIVDHALSRHGFNAVDKMKLWDSEMGEEYDLNDGLMQDTVNICLLFSLPGRFCGNIICRTGVRQLRGRGKLRRLCQSRHSWYRWVTMLGFSPHLRWRTLTDGYVMTTKMSRVKWVFACNYRGKFQTLEGVLCARVDCFNSKF